MALTQVKTSGIADDAITQAKVANDAIGLDEMDGGTDGKIIAYDANGDPHTVGPGTDGQVLTSAGAGAIPAFEDAAPTVGGANGVTFNDSVKIKLGTDTDYELYCDNTNLVIDHTADGQTSLIRAKQNGTIQFDASDTGNQVAAKFKWSNDATPVSSAELYYGGAKKAETVTGGFTVTGTCTATSFAGSGAALTGISSPLSFRNLIINGDLSIAQRGTGTSSSLNGWDNANGPDRFNMDSNLSSLTGTISQDSESPAGFSKSFKVDLTGNTGAMGATEYISIRQKIEAQNLQHLQNGTSGAVSTTLSFWVRSSITGTYGVRIRKEDNTAREITGTYAISAADTWEKKSITFAGDTAGGGIDNNNGAGLQISWVLGAGSNYTSTDSSSWINAAEAGQFYGHTATFTSQNATFYLTGVQYETGTTATEFEHIPYRNQLENCRRYFMKGGGWPMFADRTTDAHNCGRVGMYWFPVIMRTEPTMTDLSMTVYSGSAQTLGTNSIKKEWVWFNHTGSFSDGREWCLINSFTASAEL